MSMEKEIKHKIELDEAGMGILI